MKKIIYKTENYLWFLLCRRGWGWPGLPLGLPA